LAAWCKSSTWGGEAAYAGLRLLIVFAAILGTYLLLLPKLKLLAPYLLLGAYFGVSLGAGAVMQTLSGAPPTEYQESLLTEVTAIGNYLSEHEGNIVLLCSDTRGDAMLEPYLPREYYMLSEGDSELHDFLWQEGGKADLSKEKLPMHVQYSYYEYRPHLEEIHYLIVNGTPKQTVLVSESLQLCDLSTNVYKLYELKDPTALCPLLTVSGAETMSQEWVLEYRLRHLATAASMRLSFTVEIRDELAKDGAVYVVDESYRKSAIGKSGWRNCNLRTTFEKIIKRAGIEPWPKPFVNLRSTRETELNDYFPTHVVAKWLGHSEEIAEIHYL
jgi:hypothetical protein